MISRAKARTHAAVCGSLNDLIDAQPISGNIKNNPQKVILARPILNPENMETLHNCGASLYASELAYLALTYGLDYVMVER